MLEFSYHVSQRLIALKLKKNYSLSQTENKCLTRQERTVSTISSANSDSSISLSEKQDPKQDILQE